MAISHKDFQKRYAAEIRQLGFRAAGIDDLRMYGLSGKQVLHATPIVSRADRGKHGSVIVNKDDYSGEELSGHQKGKAVRNQIHKYATPRIENGVAIASKRLKEKAYATGVFFPVDEPIEPEAGKTGQPGEEYVTFSPERWDGNRVNMNGTQTMRNHGGFRGKKPRKGWKRYENK